MIQVRGLVIAGGLVMGFVLMSLVLSTVGLAFWQQPKPVVTAKALVCEPSYCSCFEPVPEVSVDTEDTDTVEYIKQVLTIKANQRK